MAEVIGLVPKEAVDRVGETRKPKGGRFRLMAIAKAQRAAAVEKESAELEEGTSETEPTRVDLAGGSGGQDAREPSADGTSALQNEKSARSEGTPASPAGKPAKAEDCFELFEVREGCLAVVWKLAKIDDWGAPVLGAACKEILGKKRIRKVVFDFTGVQEMSTTAVSTLIRFKNTIVHLEKSMCLVAGPGLRAQLAKAYVDRMIDVVDSVARVIGSEIRFQERRTVRTGKRRWWRFLLVSVLLAQFTLITKAQGAQRHEEFPSPTELEKALDDSPDLLLLRLGVEKLKLADSWTKSVNLHTSYSQHFASYVPVLSDTDQKVSGDTFVLGVSLSVSLDELLHRRGNRELALRSRQLEYERLYQSKLAAIRVLFGNRLKLLAELKALEARGKTAGLKLERVRAGLQFDFLDFTAIDLAEAEEAVTRIEVERRQTEIEIQAAETRILEVMGRAESRP